MRHNDFDRDFRRTQIIIYIAGTVIALFWLGIMMLLFWVGYTIYSTGLSGIGTEIGSFFGSIFSGFKETSQ